jgi:ethanolamine utilization protein EutP (predicted NTPase)
MTWFYDLFIDQRGMYVGSILVFLDCAVTDRVAWVMALVDSMSHNARHLSPDLSGILILNIDV